MHIYEVIKRPIVTEKSNILQDLYGQYTFEVDRRANKFQIKEAVEQFTGLRVLEVDVKAKYEKVEAKRLAVR